jgi:hypothetical protein
MREHWMVLLIAAALSAPGAVLAQGASVSEAAAKAPGVRMQAGAVEVRAKVVELDMASRTAVLRGPKGRIVSVAVPPEVKNFDQVRVGDDLVIRYMAAIAAKLEPTANRSGIRERVESAASAVAAPGDKPGMATGRMVEVLAVIEAIDRKARTATLRGVKRSVTVVVPAGIDLAKIKVGDEVRAVFTEAAVLSVDAPAKK